MKERPILFSAPMVRAILDGRKTQTRRPVKNLGFVTGIGHVLNGRDDRSEWPDFCPHGKPGDRLWIRETWGNRTKGSDIMTGTHWENPLYRADADAYGLLGHDGFGPIYEEDILWRPSIHMPRHASRISLEITGVRVERLQDIREEDAIAEGIKQLVGNGDFPCPHYEHIYFGVDGKKSVGITQSPIFAYMGIWESINGKALWDLNPFVWVLEFRRI